MAEASSNGYYVPPSALPYFRSGFETIQEVVGFLSHYLEIDGSYILRASLHSPNKYTLSVIHQGTVKHIKLVQKDGKFCLGKRRFGCVQELVDYHGSHDVPNREDVSGVRLLHPIMDTDVIYVNWVEHPRPPPPLPGILQVIQKDLKDIRESPAYIARTYSDVRDVDVDHAQDLIDQLKSSEKCECGLYLVESRLPKNWTVHRVMEADRIEKPNMPCVFFVGPDNQSNWVLPDDVKERLDLRQVRLLELLHMGGI